MPRNIKPSATSLHTWRFSLFREIWGVRLKQCGMGRNVSLCVDLGVNDFHGDPRGYLGVDRWLGNLQVTNVMNGQPLRSDWPAPKGETPSGWHLRAKYSFEGLWNHRGLLERRIDYLVSHTAPPVFHLFEAGPSGNQLDSLVFTLPSQKIMGCLIVQCSVKSL